MTDNREAILSHVQTLEAQLATQQLNTRLMEEQLAEVKKKAEALSTTPEPLPTIFIPKPLEEFFYIDSVNGVNKTHNMEIGRDKAKLSIGNCYRTRTEAVRALSRMKALRELALLAGDQNWAKGYDCSKQIWYIAQDSQDNEFHPVGGFFWRYPNVFYFKTREEVDETIHILGTEKLNLIFNT